MQDSRCWLSLCGRHILPGPCGKLPGQLGLSPIPGTNAGGVACSREQSCRAHPNCEHLGTLRPRWLSGREGVSSRRFRVNRRVARRWAGGTFEAPCLGSADVGPRCRGELVPPTGSRRWLDRGLVCSWCGYLWTPIEAESGTRHAVGEPPAGLPWQTPTFRSRNPQPSTNRADQGGWSLVRSARRFSDAVHWGLCATGPWLDGRSSLIQYGAGPEFVPDGTGKRLPYWVSAGSGMPSVQITMVLSGPPGIISISPPGNSASRMPGNM
jgi:hypothetical protein